MENEYRTIGPPGTGKTTYLSGEVNKEVRARGSKSVIIASLTRTAAAAVAGRHLPIAESQIGTLHAHAYRALGGQNDGPKLAEDKDAVEAWNTEFPHYRLSVTSSDMDATVDGRFGKGTPGDDAMQKLSVLRSKDVDPSLWPEGIRHFHENWTQWKRSNDVIDFTDMIEMAIADTDAPVGAPSVFMVDEAQDLDVLGMRLVRHWGRDMDKVLLVGDPDQCQPPWVLVNVGNGNVVPICHLDADKHKITTYDPDTGETINGLSFEKETHRYRGELYRVLIGDMSTWSTYNHKWVVRYKDDVDEYYCTVVYMHEGRGFALETVRFGDLNDDRQDLWVLFMSKDKDDVDAYRRYCDERYVRPGSRVVTNGYLKTLLADIGFHYDYPFKRNGEVRSCNLFPDIMTVPVTYDSGLTYEWEPIDNVQSDLYSGAVYSLKVDGPQTYVSDNIVTHNCIYSWRGSDPKAFISPPVPPDRRSVLGQSYRIPETVRERAVAWIETTRDRDQVEYTARREDPLDNTSPIVQGEVIQSRARYDLPEAFIDEASKHIEKGQTVMFLTSCGYMLEPVIKILRREGIPFHNPYRTARGDWNPLGSGGIKGVRSRDRLLSYLRPDEDVWGKDCSMWSWDDIYKWTAVLQSKGVLKHGAKNIAKKMRREAERPSISDLLDIILTEDAMAAALDGDLEWYEQNLMGAKRGTMRFPIEILKKRGAQVLKGTPQVIVGTAHSTKGGEADAVWVCPDLSHEGGRAWSKRHSEEANSIRRLYYVAMTRARESLYICRNATDIYVPI